MVSEWVLNERMSEMEQIVWSDFIIIIVTFIAMGWFFWSVYIRNKKKGDDEWEIEYTFPTTFLILVIQTDW